MAAIQTPVLPYIIPDYVGIIAAIDNQRKRVANARFTYPKIGNGSGRVVFDLGDGSVLKLAFNKKGIAQNKAESRASLVPYYNSLLVPVLASDRAGKWVIQRYVTPISVTGYFAFHRSEEGREFSRKAGLMASIHGLNPYDLTKPESIGFTGDKYLIFDYGLTEAICGKCYN